MTRDAVRVVAGIVIEEERVLLTRRTRTQSYSLLWEFPGGKMEPGETAAEALNREFIEELGVEVAAGEVYDRIAYPGGEGRAIDVTFLLASRVRGEPRPLEVEAVQWVAIAELDRVEFIPANQDVVRRLQEERM